MKGKWPIAWGVFAGLLLPLGAANAADKKGTIKMDVLTVQGELQKPQASYIVQRSNKISLSEDLKSKAPLVTPRILDTLQDDLFDPKP
jgi:hypothetical protein